MDRLEIANRQPDGEPVEAACCNNCGCPLMGKWWSQCGQRVSSPDPTWHELLHEVTHEFLHIDGKIFRTLRLLFLQPGELTAEYLRGRRARYISVLRLYLTMSVAYFLIA